MFSKQKFILLILFLGAGLSFYLFTAIGTKRNSHPVSVSVDWQAENIVTMQYDKTGVLSSELISPHVIHYAKNNSALVLQPQLKLYSAKEQPWIITAQKALVSDDSAKNVSNDKEKRIKSNDSSQLAVETNSSSPACEKRLDTPYPTTCGEIINLINHVTIHQAHSAHNNEETITTTQLTVFPQLQIAETKQPIRLLEKGNDGNITIVDAVGATLNKKTGIIRLLADVRGYYAKPAKVR